MRKIIIKIPKEEGAKWSLQMKDVASRRFIRAISVFSRLERTFPGKKFRGKTAIVMKRYIDGQWENVNETLVSKNPKYLLLALLCFLEDYLNKEMLDKKIKEYEEYSEDYG